MSSASILVVYQDEIYLEQVRSALLPFGYGVLPASSTAEAVVHLQRGRPRVVVVCPGVPAETSAAVTDSVRQLHPGLSVLLLSPNHMDKISDLLH